MESPSIHLSFLQLPGTLIEVIMGRSIQAWGNNLNKSISRLWSSLQYRAELGTKDPLFPTRQEEPLEVVEESCKLRREEAEMVMGRLGLSLTGWEQEGYRRDDMLGCEEIMSMFEEEEPSLEEVREAFGVFDANGDGFIDAEEICSVLRGLGFGEEVKVEDCGRMIRAFDKNGDGMIDFREFVKMMENCFC